MVCQAHELVVRSIPPPLCSLGLECGLCNLTVCYTDACLIGMAYYYPELGYQYCIPEEDQGGTIFLYEAATMTAFMLHKLNCPQLQLAIHTDSHNTVNIWNLLKVSQDYNDLLHMAIDSMLLNAFDIQVLHILQSKNLVANALSQGNNSYAQYIMLVLIIHPLKPPCDFLGTAQK